MKILDLSAGARSMWFDRQYRDAVFVDCRSEAEPDIVADTKSLPKDLGQGGGFDLIVFDPPHVNFGRNSIYGDLYGYLSAREIRQLVIETAREAHRVSRPDALMAFKWNDHDQKLSRVVALLDEYWEPLFGSLVARASKHRSATYWVMLRRRHERKFQS